MAVISLDSCAKPQVFLLCLFFPYHPPLLFCPEIRTHLGKTSHLCSSMLPMALVTSVREKSYPGPTVCPGRQELLRRDAQGPVWAGRKQVGWESNGEGRNRGRDEWDGVGDGNANRRTSRGVGMTHPHLAVPGLSKLAASSSHRLWVVFSCQPQWWDYASCSQCSQPRDRVTSPE